MALEKTCVFCGADVNGKPRMKDSSGRYACAPCAKQASRKKSAKPTVKKKPNADPAVVASSNLGQLGEHDILPVDELPDSLGVEALPEDMLASVATAPPSAGGTAPCPECGSPLKATAKLCVNCGYNPTTGKAGKTKLGETKAASEYDKKRRATDVQMASAYVGAWAGALVAAIVITGAWVGFMIGTGFTLGVWPLIIGIVVGIGTAYGCRGATSNATGVVAVLVTIVAVVAGHFTTAKIMIGQMDEANSASVAGQTYNHPFDELLSSAQHTMADEMLMEGLLAGFTLRDNEYASLTYGERIEDYAYPARGNAVDAFNALPQPEQDARLQTEALLFDGELVANTPEVHWTLACLDRLAADMLIADELGRDSKVFYSDRGGADQAQLTFDDVYASFPADYSREARKTVVEAWNSIDPAREQAYRDAHEAFLVEESVFIKEMQEFEDAIETGVAAGYAVTRGLLLGMISTIIGCAGAFKFGSSDMIL